MLVYICISILSFGSESQLRRHLLQGTCCKDLGPNCQCRSACGGSPCNSEAGELCNNGVCCCGDGCNKDPLFGADNCPTNNPTVHPTESPTQNPSKNPTKDPSPAPSNDPTKAPSKDPTSNPTSGPTQNPSKNPTDNPTSDPTLNPIIQCAKWNPESSQPTSSPVTDGSGSGNNNGIPIPDFSGSPQLCQLGKSGEWNSLDQWYSFDCSCYDVQTLYKLTQFVAGWFAEFQLNFKEEIEGRFESYFENYSTEDITFSTSLTTESGTSNGPAWQDLEDLTSCDPDNPGYGELTRALGYDFQISPGGVFIRDCVENGNVAFAQVNIPNYRIRENDFTENQVSFGYLTVERQPNTNMWLFKQIQFGGATVGYLSQNEE